MPNETSKIKDRILPLLQAAGPVGIDIGCGQDPITPECLAWDREQGDAADLEGCTPNQFDWIYSSHCLEHLPAPHLVVARWWECLRPGGLLAIVVPDEDAYEQGVWPSAWNPEHCQSFTPHKTLGSSWCPASINLTDLIKFLPNHKLRSIQIIDTTVPSKSRRDQTEEGAIAHIEMIVEKLPPQQTRTSLLESIACCATCGREEILLGRKTTGELLTRCTACSTIGTYRL